MQPASVGKLLACIEEGLHTLPSAGLRWRRQSIGSLAVVSLIEPAGHDHIQTVDPLRLERLNTLNVLRKGCETHILLRIFCVVGRAAWLDVAINADASEGYSDQIFDQGRLRNLVLE